MRALVIVHDPGSEPVMVGERLVEHGYELDERAVTVDITDPAGAADFGDPTDVDLIVPMGSVWSVYDHDRIGPWIVPELEYLRRGHEAGVPILGICFGGQAAAAALGGRVVRSEQFQIGWHPLEPVADAPALTGPWMQWHYDRFEPPADAEILASDEVGVQAFTMGRTLGLQFHPEVDPGHVRRWLELGGPDELTDRGLDPDELLARSQEVADDARTRCRALVDWFLTDIARR